MASQLNIIGIVNEAGGSVSYTAQPITPVQGIIAVGFKGDDGADSTVPGPQGPQGPQGVPGADGADGATGATGPKGDKGDKGDTGDQGPQGIQGIPGTNGTNGTNGQGVPTGGTANQYLKKNSNTDYDTSWDTLDKNDVGLGNVDNTSDTNKPVSTAQQTAIDLKQNLITLTTTGTSGPATFNQGTGALNIPSYAGGGSSGITRSVSNINSTTSAGSTALTDYVYHTTGSFTLTLPTPVGNTNRYSVINKDGGTLTVSTAAGTILGSASITMATQYQSRDFISDGSNWYIL